MTWHLTKQIYHYVDTDFVSRKLMDMCQTEQYHGERWGSVAVTIQYLVPVIREEENFRNGRTF